MDAVREQLALAHGLTLRGCYRCLIEARDLYDDLARQGFETDEGATTGLLRTTLLIGMREREMGLPDGGTRARTLETALGINPRYCYAAFHLGRVHIEEARWIETATAFSRAAGCFGETAGRLTGALSELEQDPTLVEDRRARLVQRRTAELAVVRRQAASSAYNAALGYHNDGTLPVARRYAHLARQHEMFPERATRLLGLIDAVPTAR